MRIRTILIAAAAPAALAAILLGTAGQASAQVAPPAQAALTASVKQATISATTHVHNVADTTNISGDHTGTSDNGPVWAYDNLERKITATRSVTGTDTWDVRIDSQGSFSAIANPLDGNVWTGGNGGSVTGSVNYTVTSGKTPDPKNINGNLPDGTGSTKTLKLLFGDDSATVVGGTYKFDYSPVPVPDDVALPDQGYQGIFWGQGASGQHYVQVG
jgi:hypothetical protein